MNKERYFELDAMRGIALICMIAYHILFCLYFFNTGFVPDFDPQKYPGTPICFMFVFIAGISISLMTAHHTDSQTITKKLFVRSVQILLCAALVTFVTWIIYPSGFVIFGVLHLIGISTLLMIPLHKIRPVAAFIIGMLLIALSAITIHGPLFLLPFGFGPGTISMIDYEPLIPWFGVILLGYAAGLVLYRNGQRCFLLSKLKEMPKILVPLCYLGRHTLIIYLIHVPLIILTLLLFGIVSFPF